jgi:hypothetical protein
MSTLPSMVRLSSSDFVYPKFKSFELVRKVVSVHVFSVYG